MTDTNKKVPNPLLTIEVLGGVVDNVSYRDEEGNVIERPIYKLVDHDQEV